ncbi:Uncharacterised protein [Serratia marcescens]|uniref:hypothetical protein n=2 Tax=Serratia TaxID=613 RepID=UPI000744EE51|nr:hypothetical protein [Serratia marcescens]PHY73295.1 hypothetical protein CS366_02840 [Serratia marcescens]PIC08775.1 hypothetical protein CS367_12060 [Serratia marcescens]QOU01386.1 hypothetical protein SCH909_4234 [Serratia marcescens]CUY86573.1 Uncharacterised protein [Serratia marcescens]CUZ49541.1 Uncharacterised protein [Serratia marcescens]
MDKLSAMATFVTVAEAGSFIKAAEWGRAGRWVPVLLHWHFQARSIHLIYLSNENLSMRVRCFVDWVLALMKENSSLHMSPLALAESM